MYILYTKASMRDVTVLGFETAMIERLEYLQLFTANLIQCTFLRMKVKLVHSYGQVKKEPYFCVFLIHPVETFNGTVGLG